VFTASRVRTLVLLLLLGLIAVPAAAQEGPRRAALVVRYPDGHVQTRCVGFSEPSLTGDQLLERSGFKILVNPGGAFGGAVCRIDDVGCNYPTQDCFCRCMGTQCEYWAYYHLLSGASAGAATWQYSVMGAGSYEVKDGAVEGWSWGPGNFSSGTEPPKITFAEICNAASGNQAVAANRPSGLPDLTRYVGFAVALLILLIVGLVVLRRRTG
jgi:hypothetical protein